MVRPREPMPFKKIRKLLLTAATRTGKEKVT
jgi:hypothetical protein